MLEDSGFVDVSIGPAVDTFGGAGGEDGPVFELSAAAPPWPPSLVVAVLLSFLIFEHPAPPIAIAVSKSTTQTRTVSLGWYDDVTWAILSSGQVNCWRGLVSIPVRPVGIIPSLIHLFIESFKTVCESMIQ